MQIDECMDSICATTAKSRPAISFSDCVKNRTREAIAFIVKDFKIATTYKLQFIFQFLQIFFSIMVIYFIGRMFEGGGKSSFLARYEADYFSFALVGLAVTSYCRAGLVNITNDIRQIMTQGTLEAMCATPLGHNWLLLCSSLWQFVFETVRVVFYFVVGIVVFGMRLDNANWPGAVIAAALTVPVFLMLGIISCSILILVKKGDPINWIFSSLAGLLAGTMFPLEVLPGWLQRIAYCIPLTYSLEAMRRFLLMNASIRDTANYLWALLAFSVILVPVTILINKFCMRLAKIKGALSTH